MRLRITFSKTEAMRYTGHLDLHRTWERTIRRSGLPLAYTQGFRPHPRINLGCALPLGFTSQAEVVDIWLENEDSLDRIESSLRSAAPPGIEISCVERPDEHAPALQSELIAAKYELTFLEPIPDLAGRIHSLLNEKSLPRQRRGKDYDLRSLILDLTLLPNDGGGNPRLSTLLSAREGATGRPEELVLALGGDPLSTRVHRSHLVFRQQAVQRDTQVSTQEFPSESE